MPVLTKINTNSIADDAITAEKYSLEASGYVANTTNQNISGTYSDNRMYTSDAYTLSANATVNGNLTLSTVKPTADVVLTAGGAYTLTGSGVLSGGDMFGVRTDLTGMTGERGSVVTGTPAITGSPALHLNNAIFPVGQDRVVYHHSIELAANTGTTTTSTAWVADWISLVVPADITATLSKIVVHAYGQVRIDKDAHAIADFGIVRIAATDYRFDHHVVGAASTDCSQENYHSVSLMAVEDLAYPPTGQRTYQIHTRKTNGTSSYASNIYYKFQGWTMQVTGYA